MSIKDWINNNFFDEDKKKELLNEFKRAKPFRHLSIRDILNQEKANEVFVNLKKEKFSEKDSDLFHFWQTDDLKYTNNKVLREFVDFLNSKEFADFMIEISGIKIKTGSSDLFGSLYKKTNYLLCHDDQLEGRRIAYLFYFTKDFKEKDGGALALLEDNKGKPGKKKHRHIPLWNSLMFFEVSKKSWHQVEEILEEKERYAIGGWLY